MLLDIRPGVFTCAGPPAASWSVVLLRLAYLAATNALAFLRLLPMSDRDKDIRDPRTPAPTAGPTASSWQADPHRQRPCHPRRPAPRIATCSSGAGSPPCRDRRTQATRTPTHHPIDTRPGPAPGQGEHLMEIPTDPRRTHSAGNQDRRLHGLGVSMAVECWSRTMGWWAVGYRATAVRSGAFAPGAKGAPSGQGDQMGPRPRRSSVGRAAGYRRPAETGAVCGTPLLSRSSRRCTTCRPGRGARPARSRTVCGVRCSRRC